MSDLVAFLKARLDEDEAAARAATPGRWKLWGMSVMADQDGTSNVGTAVGVASTAYRNERGAPRTWDADHIARHDPARVLREVEAKRRIVDSADDWPYGSGDPENVEIGWHDHAELTLRLLALPYADHPDYDPGPQA